MPEQPPFQKPLHESQQIAFAPHTPFESPKITSYGRKFGTSSCHFNQTGLPKRFTNSMYMTSSKTIGGWCLDEKGNPPPKSVPPGYSGLCTNATSTFYPVQKYYK
uniref:Uncharacterized protein n=1 Tax=Haptolina ericina TaxID=156174 RepID=A0A7S3AW52_9EUKA|mmetsp:Transcript_38988/g.88557  ORF Transcript_38988/g.88557 Transcript_38988/m.88557 type:complete len:105 (+) Transcript_38988:70-384(+)